MFSAVSNLFNRGPQSRSGPLIPETPSGFRQQPSPMARGPSSAGLSYTKVFRWRLADGHTEAPKSVEVAGSFNHWQKVPMLRDSVLDAWHVTIHHIPGNKTHHYMIFVDGKPVNDKHCDGLAVPNGPLEEQAAIQTVRGPRVFMLFGQTK
ncbi:MAG: hypothetical protein EXS35_18180 [Pedosphaera sp.]|nr:hypothetical protein [Pedosphaera sp.]